MASMHGNEFLGSCTSEVLSPLLAATVPNMHDSDLIPRTPPQSPRSTSCLLSHVSAAAPATPVDVSALRNENRAMKSRIRQLQVDLQSEQDTVASLRKRTNNVEKERLDAISKANEEISRMDSESTKLRAQLEKGEAVRQSLEFELTKAKREVDHGRRHATDRESLMTEVNDTMKQKISELTAQVEQLCEQLDVTKQTAAAETCKLSTVIDGKDKLISEKESENDLLEADRDRLESALQQKECTITDLEDRIQELEDARILDKESLRRQMTETEIIREREERSKADLESSLMKITALEENIEAERAAHLESKFNSEIIQLRLRDLEGALEMEKSVKTEMSSSHDKLEQQVRELRQVYDDERKSGLQTRENLEKAEKEYAALSRQLRVELDDKKTVIKTLSDQLDVHQRNFNELKQELSKAKKRQVFLEETYSGSMKELEVLVQGFQLSHLDPPTKDSTTAAGKKKLPPKKNPNKVRPPAVLLESLRYLLIDYKRKLDQTNSDFTRVKVQNEAMAKECIQHRDLMAAKDKALASAQQGMASTSKDLARVRGECKDAESLVRQLQDELRLTQRTLDQAQAQNTDLGGQVVQIATKCKGDEQTHVEFLQNVYQQLMILSRPTIRDAGSEGPPMLPSTANELTVLVNERINVLLNYLQAAEEKVKELELAVESRENVISELQKLHEQHLQRLSTLTEDRSQQWQQQKEEMEQHYSRLLTEVHSRQKKTQTLADQAWEKMRITGSVQHSLEAECAQLRAHLEQCQREHGALLTACALLCGAIYPLYARCTALATQRHLLSEQLTNQEGFKHQVQALVEALSLDSKAEEHKRGKKKHPPLLRFRVGAIAVMAANRLCHMSHGNCRMFTANDALPGLYSMSVCTGGLQPKPRDFTGVWNTKLFEEGKALKRGEEQAVCWLTSNELLSTVVATMTDLQASLEQAKQQGETYDSRKVVNAARCSFQKLICNLPAVFASAPVDQQFGVRDRVSTVRFLGHGLNQALAHLTLEGATVPHLVNSQNTITNLQHHIVEFTQRLHAAEVERRDMRLELGQLQQQRQQWTQHTGALEQVQSEVNDLRQQVVDTVERQQFDHVCQELNNALTREQEAQEIMRVQSQQIHELGLRLDVQVTEGSEKEHTLVDAIQGMSAAKMELKRQEQKVRQLNRQISQLEAEKKTVDENVTDAENALRTAAKDKDAITTYMRSVERVLEQTQTAAPLGGAPTDFTPLLSPELIPSHITKKGPELIACQTLVSAFVATQKQLDAKIWSLREEVEAYKQHIGSLKKELSDACRREYEDEIQKMKITECVDPASQPDELEPPTRDQMDTSKHFKPLEPDNSSTFCTPNPVSAKAKASSNSTPKSKPLVYRTPRAAGKTSRRKPAEGMAKS